jgi:tRNA threonylcarbamoyl adenosine modification protein YeaZ
MDGVTLIVDASTYDGSVAVAVDGVLRAERTIAMRGITEERLMPAVAEAVDEVGGRTVLRRVVCGGGPGSFTSLRIAAGIAKGLCAGLQLPLFGVSSLHLAVPVLPTGRYVLTMDALRDEVYAAALAWDGTRVVDLAPVRIVATTDLTAYADEFGARVEVAAPHARAAVSLLDTIIAGGTVDRATWEPTYGRLAEAQVKWEATHGRSLTG